MTLTLERKALTLEAFKATDEGEVTAVFATLGVVDKDGDVTLPGFFGEQDTAMVWAHDKTEPIGRGSIREEGDKAIFEGSFFMDVPGAVDRFKTVKGLGELQEWSYNYRLYSDGFRFGDFEGKQVRFLTPRGDGSPGAIIPEVSPVLVGAGEGTGTRSIKSDRTFVDEAEDVARDIEALVARAAEIKAMRVDKGADLGSAARQRLLNVKTRLDNAGAMLFELTAQDAPDEPAVVIDFAATRAKQALATARATIERYGD